MGEQEADSDGFDLLAGEYFRRRGDARLVQRRDHSAFGVDALDGFQAAMARHQRRRPVDREIVQALHRPLDPADLQHVAEPRRGQEADFRTGALDQGIGAGGRAVDHLDDAVEADPFGRCGRANGFHHPDGAVVRRRRHLRACQPAALVVGDHHIGKRAADVDGEAVSGSGFSHFD